jgi:hypothetical protein
MASFPVFLLGGAGEIVVGYKSEVAQSQATPAHSPAKTNASNGPESFCFIDFD